LAYPFFLGSTYSKSGFLVNKLSRLNDADGTNAIVGTSPFPKRAAVNEGINIINIIKLLF